MAAEGRPHLLRALVAGALSLLLCLSPVRLLQALAATPIVDLTDTLSSAAVNQPNAQHDISFSVPVGGAQVTPTDYVIIDLPKYTSVRLPTSVYGGYGQPDIEAGGATRVLITNLAILPGASVQILGLVATNPNAATDFGVTVTISPNQSGVPARDQGTVAANQSGPFVSVSATIESQYALLVVTGYTAPGSFITLGENGTVIATSLSAGDGSYTLSVSGLSSSEHVFSVSGTDSNNLTTAITTETVYTLPQTVTTVSDVLLSPTIQVTPPTIAPGDALTISGSAKPLTTVNVFTESPLVSYAVTSDANGAWTYQLTSATTRTYQPGQYRAYANAQEDSGTQSITSNTVNFTVALPPNSDNPPPNCDISHGDLNCDTKTNLTDFSILLFYWRTNRKKADINSDGSVNLTDFSIMMFYFQR